MIEPQPGDVIQLDGPYWGAPYGSRAVINGGDHYGPDEVMAVFGSSTFRNGNTVSCSGGPCPAIPKTELEYAGTIEWTFWRWKDLPRAGGGEDYKLRVNLWSWNPERSNE